MRDPEKNRVGVLGEFGGLGMPIKGHTWQQEKNWGYVSYDSKEKLTDAYVALLTAMRPLIGRGLSDGRSKLCRAAANARQVDRARHEAPQNARRKEGLASLDDGAART